MLAFIGNLGFPELVLIALVAVLIFGKDLPQAASKAYVQVRKLRNAVDDLRRESGIDKELRDIERTVREAEWEARRAASSVQGSVSSTKAPAWRSLPGAPAPEPSQGDARDADETPARSEPPAGSEDGPGPTTSAS